jgi:hypothetical protein
MTLPVERYNAVVNTEQFLLQLAHGDLSVEDIRQQARRLLRHYPSRFSMDMAADESSVFDSAWEPLTKWIVDEVDKPGQDAV